MTDRSKIESIIRNRLIAKHARELLQGDLIAAYALFKNTVEARLQGIASGRQMYNFERCGNEQIYCTCSRCHTVTKFCYACNRKWCPACSPKLAARRAAYLRIWCNKITQPKHLVLTMRNFNVLTRNKIREFQRALLKLRKLNLWKTVKGGCCSIEITNTGEGWHLHAHLLLDCRWLDMERLSQIWGSLLGQTFGIVKIKDVRGTDFVSEVTKYVVKGNELASWDGQQIWEFICAIRGCRFFTSFGNLFDMRRTIKAELHAAKSAGKVCQCGCEKFVYETEADAIIHDLQRQKTRR